MYKAPTLNRGNFTGKLFIMTSVNNWLLDSRTISATNRFDFLIPERLWQPIDYLIP